MEWNGLSNDKEEGAPLYLIPTAISDVDPKCFQPPEVLRILHTIRCFAVENIRTARRFLKRCDPNIDVSSLIFNELNSRTPVEELHKLIELLLRGEPVGVMSEAGCPGVADPGAELVALAQEKSLRVIPLVGPSSIILSLMASGFNGQRFSFHGYLPVNSSNLGKELRVLETISTKRGSTEIFIETPYRNQKMLETIVATLKPDTMLCVATAVTDPQKESILSMPVRKWKNIQLAKEPSVFLIFSR